MMRTSVAVVYVYLGEQAKNCSEILNLFRVLDARGGMNARMLCVCPVLCTEVYPRCCVSPQSELVLFSKNVSAQVWVYILYRIMRKAFATAGPYTILLSPRMFAVFTFDECLSNGE